MSKSTCLLPMVVALGTSSAFGGGFDSSGQPFGIILGDDAQFSISVSSTSSTLNGIANSKNTSEANNTVNGEIANEVDLSSTVLGIRLPISDAVSCAVQIDTPYQTDTYIEDDSLNYYYSPHGPWNTNYVDGGEDTPFETDVNSNAITLGCGFGIQVGISRFTIYGGPKMQKLEGQFSADLLNNQSGASGSVDNLNYDLSSNYDWGYVAGIAFEIPEYALKAALTYHSSITHEMEGRAENGTAITTATAALALSATDEGDTVKAEVDTPQAVNITLQTGVMPNWLVFANLRWVEWSELSSLDVIADTNAYYDIPLGLFSNDTLNYTIGVGHQATEKLAILASVGSSTTLGDEDDGYDSLRQAVGDNYTISLGGSYSLNNHFALKGGLGFTVMDSFTMDNGTYLTEFDAKTITTVVFGADVTI